MVTGRSKNYNILFYNPRSDYYSMNPNKDKSPRSVDIIIIVIKIIIKKSELIGTVYSLWWFIID
jgi:hypothetical protein